MNLMSMNNLLYILLIICEIIVIVLLSVSTHNDKKYDDGEREMYHMTGYYQGYRDSLVDVKNVILSKGREIREDDLINALNKHDELWGRIFKKYRD